VSRMMKMRPWCETPIKKDLSSCNKRLKYHVGRGFYVSIIYELVGRSERSGVHRFALGCIQPRE